jgi:hypothetical protein
MPSGNGELNATGPWKVNRYDAWQTVADNLNLVAKINPMPGFVRQNYFSEVLSES